MREQFFPAAAAGEHPIEPAGPLDGNAIEALAAAWMCLEELDLLRRWWSEVLGAFRVARDETGAVAGFACLIEPADVSARLIDRDPLARRWREHLRRDPVPPGQRTLFLRHLAGKRRSLAQAALLLDTTRTYMERRPHLRRVYAAARDFVGADASCALVMGYLPLDDDPASVCVDFGPASVDGWLAELGERELLVQRNDGVEPSERRIVLDGRSVDLTRLEAEVLAYLARGEGKAVERAALLRDVWGYDWTGGSIVVEVVISSLRRKLGDRATALETVRGVGYRLRPME